MDRREATAGDGARRIGMVLYGDLSFDSRVRKEASSLAAAGNAVLLVCLANRSGTDDLDPGVTVIVRAPAGDSVIPGATTKKASNPFLRGRGSALAAMPRRVWLSRYAQSLRAWGAAAVAAAGPVDAWHLHDLPALVAVMHRVPKGIP